MITFAQKEVEDLIDTLEGDEERTNDRFLAIGLGYAHRVLALRLAARVNEQALQFEQEWSEEINPETILCPIPPRSTEPEVD